MSFVNNRWKASSSPSLSSVRMESEFDLEFLLYQNMHQILDERGPITSNAAHTLWLGDVSAALNTNNLIQKGIRTVLTTASGLNVSYSQESGIRHRSWTMLDHPSYIISVLFGEVIHEIREGLKRGSVLVHCAAGVSRSATCVIAFLMAQRNLTYQTAFKYVKERRPVVHPNHGFVRQLMDFEKEKRSISRAAISSSSRRSQTALVNKRELKERPIIDQQPLVQSKRAAALALVTDDRKIESKLKQQQQFRRQSSMRRPSVGFGCDDVFIAEQMNMLKAKKSSQEIINQSNRFSSSLQVSCFPDQPSPRVKFFQEKRMKGPQADGGSPLNGSLQIGGFSSSVFDKLFQQQMKIKSSKGIRNSANSTRQLANIPSKRSPASILPIPRVIRTDKAHIFS